ncbi:hypothetical protein UY3_14502 [Chelonia mydas]|uniref:Uncharacterized protein n=1 Tax=Chelonia mydas TaxID=8469 RepID=M7B8C8_CHEMY|nr:hypothetical protein UY3_14502 [Chelonia mydas]
MTISLSLLQYWLMELGPSAQAAEGHALRSHVPSLLPTTHPRAWLCKWMKSPISVLLPASTFCQGCFRRLDQPVIQLERGSGTAPQHISDSLLGSLGCLSLKHEVQVPHYISSSNGSKSVQDEVNLLDKLTSSPQDFSNISLSYDEANCSVLEVGQYSTLSIPTLEAFGDRFADELSVLLKLRYSLKEETSLLTILSHRSHVLFQIRINPLALVFVTTRRRHYEFPNALENYNIPALRDCSDELSPAKAKEGKELLFALLYGSQLSISAMAFLHPRSSQGSECEERGLSVGKGALQQLTFQMGDPGAAGEYCGGYNTSCASAFSTEAFRNQSRSPGELSPAWPEAKETNEIQESYTQGSKFTTSDLAVRPPLVWENPQENLRPSPNGSSLTSAPSTKRLSGEEEEEERLSIEEEGFELLNSTYNKITGPGRPGVGKSELEVAGNASDSITTVTSVPPSGRRDAQVADDNVILSQTSAKVNRPASKKDHVSKSQDENITTDKLKGDTGSWTWFSPSKPIDAIIDLDNPSIFSKVSAEVSQTAGSAGNIPRAPSSDSHRKVKVPVGEETLERPSKASLSPEDAVKPMQTSLDAEVVPTEHNKGAVHQGKTDSEAKGSEDHDLGGVLWTATDGQQVRVKPGPRGPQGPPGLPVESPSLEVFKARLDKALAGMI